MSRVLLVCLFLAALSFPAAQQPRIQNAKVQTRQATSVEREAAPLAAANPTTPFWIAWREPIIDGEHDLCCSSYDSFGGNAIYIRGCAIDPVSTGDARPSFPQTTGPVKLEAGTGLVLLARFVGGRIERLRTLSDDCPLDAGGRSVYWLEGVSADASLAYLKSLMNLSDGTTDYRRRIADSAMSAMAYHRDPGATDMLIGLAHIPGDPHVRAQALSALGRRDDRRVTPELLSAVAKDPDAEVRRSAVQGLAKQPKDTSIPHLIDLAKTTKDTGVRKEAMHWLEQSKDARAVAFFEEILKLKIDD